MVPYFILVVNGCRYNSVHIVVANTAVAFPGCLFGVHGMSQYLGIKI